MLGIVLINYNSEKELVHYVYTEISKITYPYKICIVNNSASVTSNQIFIKELGAVATNKNDKTDHASDIFLLSPENNLGYARANNLGAQFLNDLFNINYILFSNSDIVFVDMNVVEMLISKAASDNNIGGIGPRVIGDNGLDQSPIIFIHPVKYLAKYLFKPVKRKILKNSNLESENTFNDTYKEGYCYTVSGCFMLVKTDVFLLAGKFDPDTFLYSEERILSERLNKIGSRFYYFPDVSVLHHEGTITRKSFNMREMKSFLFDSEYHYYTKYIISNPLVLLSFKSLKYFRKLKKST